MVDLGAADPYTVPNPDATIRMDMSGKIHLKEGPPPVPIYVGPGRNRSP